MIYIIYNKKICISNYFIYFILFLTTTFCVLFCNFRFHSRQHENFTSKPEEERKSADYELCSRRAAEPKGRRTGGAMKPSAVLLLLTVGSVCRQAAAERQLAFVTVVSSLRYICATEAAKIR